MIDVKIKKLKEVELEEDLTNYEIKINDKWYRIVSGWSKGLWLQGEGKKVIPYFFEDFKEIERLEVRKRFGGEK